MNLFETLIHPDREENEERAEVARAANILQVGEFQLLQLAYGDWFDKDLPTALIDRLFSQYMLYNIVPHWARHYARKIMIMEERGILDDLDPHYHRYDRDYHTSVPNGARRFAIAVIVLFLCLGGGLVLASLSITGGTSILPPYFDRDDIRPRLGAG